jgi:hypothetical protein
MKTNTNIIIIWKLKFYQMYLKLKKWKVGGRILFMRISWNVQTPRQKGYNSLYFAEWSFMFLLDLLVNIRAKDGNALDSLCYG